MLEFRRIASFGAYALGRPDPSFNLKGVDLPYRCRVLRHLGTRGHEPVLTRSEPTDREFVFPLVYLLAFEPHRRFPRHANLNREARAAQLDLAPVALLMKFQERIFGWGDAFRDRVGWAGRRVPIGP
jgi:hypothetical protein